MAFRSHAQKKKFAELVKAGKLTQKEFDTHHAGTEYPIPERVTPQGSPKVKSLLPRLRK